MAFNIGDVVDMEWADDLPLTEDDLKGAKVIDIDLSICSCCPNMYVLELRNGQTIDADEGEIMAVGVTSNVTP